VRRAETLLSEAALHRSSVVANRRMNRERNLTGGNGYDRDLRLHPLELLRERGGGPATWIDLCCGTGRALIQAAALVASTPGGPMVRIEGIDLVGMFDPNPHPEVLTLVEASIEAWLPREPADLITCVHGLHYVGDKLGVIARAARSLRPDGLFVASLGLDGFRSKDGRPAGRLVAGRLREAGAIYDARHRLLRVEGRRELDTGLVYLGADDRMGPNYTGQNAVASFYDVA
jgi:SAM-dependent methyltransferase